MRVTRITRAGKADVFNMEVDGTHDFVIQGGVIAHNCADETRYFCMSRPIKPRAAAAPDNYTGVDPRSLFLDIPREAIRDRQKKSRIEITRSKQ